MPLSKTDFLRFEKYAYKLAKKCHVPDFSVVIISGADEHVICSGETSNANTLFPIGSLSKAFAATVAARLVDKRLIAWQDDITPFIKPYALPGGMRLSLEHLLAHINPLPEHSLTQLSEFEKSRDALFKKLKHISIRDKVQFSYQNVLFALIAKVTEQLTSKSYEQFLYEEILKPLRMENTTYSYDGFMKSLNRATPHISDNSKKVIKVKNSRYWTLMGPPSQIATSANDLKQWLRFHLGDGCPILSSIQFNKCHKPLDRRYSSYALGWWQVEGVDEVVYCHTGGVTGFESAIAIIPRHNTAIAVSCNLTGANFPSTLINHLCQELLTVDNFNCTDAISLSSDRRLIGKSKKAYLGHYNSTLLGNIDVYLKDEALYMTVGDNGIVAKLHPKRLHPFHKGINSQLKELATHEVFLIEWQGAMTASAKAYYFSDYLAFCDNKDCHFNSLLLYLPDTTAELIRAENELLVHETGSYCAVM